MDGSSRAKAFNAERLPALSIVRPSVAMDRLSKQRFVLVLLLAAAILQTDVEAQSSIKLHQFKAVDIGPSARVFESDR